MNIVELPRLDEIYNKINPNKYNSEYELQIEIFQYLIDNYQADRRDLKQYAVEHGYNENILDSLKYIDNDVDLLFYSELDQLDMQEEVFYHPYVIPERVTMIFGYTKSGKTNYIFGLMNAIADENQNEFLGFPINAHGRCLYVDAELNRNDHKSRRDSFLTENAQKNIAVYCKSGTHINGEMNLANISFQNTIKRIIAKHSIKVAVFDNLQCLTSNDEDKSKDFGPIAKYMNDLKMMGVACVIVHHSTKQPKNQAGSQRHKNALDLVVLIEAAPNSKPNVCESKAKVTDTRMTLPDEYLSQSWRINQTDSGLAEWIDKSSTKQKPDELKKKYIKQYKTIIELHKQNSNITFTELAKAIDVKDSKTAKSRFNELVKAQYIFQNQDGTFTYKTLK